MKADLIPFKNTGYFTPIINDYLAGDDKIAPFYQQKIDLASFKTNFSNRNFSDDKRKVLTEALFSQYERAGIKIGKFEKVNKNIQLLGKESTFTITTGHQLCLFTGPLYFIYKIVSVLKLCKELKKEYPEQEFIPVYWMATEDHDFEEINHFRFKEKKYTWNTNQQGAVGRMKLDGLEEIYEQFAADLPEYSTHAEQLKGRFEKAYLKHKNLADATRYLVNELFSEYGLLVLDGDEKNLKEKFSPVVKQELLTEFSSDKVGEQSEDLGKYYKTQVNPREINLFYLTEGSRKRIIKAENAYLINETSLSFTEKEILTELEQYPEKFSPNVLLRPVYQEVILPNLAYIGGGGELAYWFQLKSTFEAVNTPMPALILRNSVVWMDEKQSKIYRQLSLDLPQLFKKEGVLLKEWVSANSEIDLILDEEKKSNKDFFEKLKEKANLVDESLLAHVEAVKTRQQKALHNLSDKFIRAKRREEKEAEQRIHLLKSELFPNGGLQERTANFSEIYLEEGSKMIDILLETFTTPTADFIVIRK